VCKVFFLKFKYDTDLTYYIICIHLHDTQVVSENTMVLKGQFPNQATQYNLKCYG